MCPVQPVLRNAFVPGGKFGKVLLKVHLGFTLAFPQGHLSISQRETNK